MIAPAAMMVIVVMMFVIIIVIIARIVIDSSELFGITAADVDGRLRNEVSVTDKDLELASSPNRAQKPTSSDTVGARPGKV